MPEYTNQICPVCKKKFEKDDNIVVCPDCGTPHHRECYKLAGHCVNQGLHQSGYDYYQNIKKEQDSESRNDAIPFPTFSDTRNSETEKENSTEQQKAENIPSAFFPQNAFEFKNPYDNDKSTISEEKISDVAATVRSNVPRFIGKFKQIEATKKKTGWNWGAFIFGAYYYLYRKMYKQGILYLLVTTALSFATVFLIGKFAPETYQYILNFVSEVSKSPSTVSSDVISNLSGAADYQNAYIISAVISIVNLLIRIIAAVFADNTYKKCVTDIIKSVDKKLDEGASFIQNPLFSGMENTPSESQIRQMYLSKKGGTSIFIPIIAYLIVDILTAYL